MRGTPPVVAPLHSTGRPTGTPGPLTACPLVDLGEQGTRRWPQQEGSSHRARWQFRSTRGKPGQALQGHSCNMYPEKGVQCPVFYYNVKHLASHLCEQVCTHTTHTDVLFCWKEPHFFTK